MKPTVRPRTWETYRSIIKVHVKPALGNIRLQELNAFHLDAYYKEKAAGAKDAKPLSLATVEKHHILIAGALKRAVKKQLVRTNVAQLVDNRPKPPEGIPQDVTNVWDGPEAKAFLAAAREAGPQPAALYALALDSGMRKGELCGLGWEHLDLEAGKLSVQRTLVKPGKRPVFGIPKNGQARVIHLGPETVALLKAHKKHQAEIKMKNRTTYNDLGLVFAKDWSRLTRHGDTLGDPLQSNNLGQREFADLITKAEVKKIKFHGMRHTSATLLLKAGVPPKVVQERLGHKSIEITMDIYAHVLPGMQEDAAVKLASILHG